MACVQAQELEPIRDFDLQTIEALGREIYRADLYASVATDILLSQGLDLGAYPIRGWIVTDTVEGPLVTFVGAYEDGLRAAFDIRPESTDDDIFEIVEGRMLTADEHARFSARQTASEAVTETCSPRYNTVVLPDPATDGWLVYLLAATTDANVIPAGGHYRISTAADGLSIWRTDRLSVSCLALDKSEARGPDGGEPVMMVMSHIVSKTPVETHVYLSLLHEIGFAIVTGENEYWMVLGSEIERIEQ